MGCLLVSVVCDAWCDVVMVESCLSSPLLKSSFIPAERQGTKELYSHVMETSEKDGFRIWGISVRSANRGGDRCIGAFKPLHYHNSLRSHKVLY